MLANKLPIPLFLGAALLIASSASIVSAQNASAPLTTGSVNSANQPLASPKGSLQFQNAIKLLNTGKSAQAYAAARGFASDVERRTIQWAAIRFGEGQVDAQSIKRFRADAPHFESSSIFKIRTEQSLLKRSPDHKSVINTIGGEMPRTIDGQIALASAYVRDGQTSRAAGIAKSIWINNFLTKNQEAAFTANLGQLVSRDDHWKRAIHLLMHDRASGTERILKHLTPAQKSLARARIAVSRKTKDAATLIGKVDPSLRDHPLLHFNRAQYHRDNGALTKAVTHINKATGALPDAAEFWYERRLIVRRALAAGQPSLAYKAAAGYKDGPEGRVVDANFHAGWIAFSYLNDPKTAQIHFERMLTLSTLSSTISQGNFWLGRARLANGDNNGATQAYQIAAKFGSEYYGQLSREALGQKIVTIRGLPEWRNSETSFERLELVQAIRLLWANKQPNFAQTLMRRLVYAVSEPGHYVLAARLAQSINAHHLAILVADAADKKGIPLDLFLYPKDGIPSTAKFKNISRSAVYAIARQESKFDIDATSRVGARGLMQLMPATAKEVAGKLGVAYSKSKLTTDAHYNTLLGSTYLAGQMRRYDGSLVLAAAAYNAGAGNVNKWLKRFGDPRKSNIDAISWVELIPFVETRKYVQRVMANYLVYNERLGQGAISMSKALKQIPN